MAPNGKAHSKAGLPGPSQLQPSQPPEASPPQPLRRAAGPAAMDKGVGSGAEGSLTPESPGPQEGGAWEHLLLEVSETGSPPRAETAA